MFKPPNLFLTRSDMGKEEDIERFSRKIDGTVVSKRMNMACRFLTRTRSAEPAAPTPFKKFRHRELAQQKTDTAIAGMAGETTIPPPFPAAILVRPTPMLLLSDAAALVVVIEAVVAAPVEVPLSVSTPFCALPPFLRAAKSSATTAFVQRGRRRAG